MVLSFNPAVKTTDLGIEEILSHGMEEYRFVFIGSRLSAEGTSESTVKDFFNEGEAFFSSVEAPKLSLFFWPCMGSGLFRLISKAENRER